MNVPYLLAQVCRDHHKPIKQYADTRLGANEDSIYFTCSVAFEIRLDIAWATANV